MPNTTNKTLTKTTKPKDTEPKRKVLSKEEFIDMISDEEKILNAIDEWFDRLVEKLEGKPRTLAAEVLTIMLPFFTINGRR
jgi:predicted HAD superfamily phosphohydrolase